MNEHLFSSLIGMIILLIIGAVIKNSRDKKAMAKQEKQQEQKRQEEQARIAKELKEAHELEDAKVDIYVNCHMMKLCRRHKKTPISCHLAFALKG